MSYSLEMKCSSCRKQEECNDRCFLWGAIDGIHSNQIGHKGAGTVDLNCQNFDAKDE